MNLEVFSLGTGGMMPLPGRFLTSMLIRRDGDLFLFDCGEGTQVSLKMLSLKWKKINAIFISHMHADHVTGLPGMLMLSSQVDRTDPLYIFGPDRLKEYVEKMKSSLSKLSDWIIRNFVTAIPLSRKRGKGSSTPGRRLNTAFRKARCGGFCSTAGV